MKPKIYGLVLLCFLLTGFKKHESMLGPISQSLCTDTDYKTLPSISNYIVVWGEFGLSGYGIPIKQLCISQVRARTCPPSNVTNPAFMDAFNEVVYGLYPGARDNPYLTGYHSNYKCFEDEDEAAAFRKRKINNAVKVDYINW